MIKTILFDNNGVIAFCDDERTIPNFAKYFGINEAYLRSFYHKEAEPFDEGLITTEEFFRNLSKIIDKEYDFEELKDLYIRGYDIKPGMINCLEEIKKDHEIALLTNQGNIFDEINESKWKYGQIFGDNIFVSAKLNMIKPNKDIFLYVLKKLNRKPQEVIFVDDRISNVEAAEKIGMKGILFKDITQFKAELDAILEEEKESAK